MTPLLVHCHMPKTAGSALNRKFLMPRFAEDAVKLAYGPLYDRLREIDYEAGWREGCGFLAGHLPFGCADAVHPDPIYISILRDPVERVISFMNFVAVADRHGVRGHYGESLRLLAREDAAAFAERLIETEDVLARQSNVMVRLASGMARFSRKTPGPWRLEKAKKNARSGRYLIGVQEAFTSFAIELIEHLDFHHVGRDGLRPTAKTKRLEKRFDRLIRREDLSSAVIDKISAANDLDQRFYDFVVERSLKRMAA